MSGAPSVDAIAACLRETLSARILHQGVVFDDRSSLPELGVDSMAYARLLVAVERRFGIQLPDDAMTTENLESVASLSRALWNASGAA